MFLSFKNNRVANSDSKHMSALQRNLQAADAAPAGNEIKHPSARNGAIFPGLLTKLVLVLAALGIVTGCKTQSERHDKMPASSMTNAPTGGTNAVMAETNAPTHSETIILREGDVLRITFPTAPNLNTAGATIRRDGNVSLTLVGDVKAAGKTLAQLKEDILTLYKDQTDSKEVTVELASSLFPVFVTGAVLSRTRSCPTIRSRRWKRSWNAAASIIPRRI